MTEKSIKGTDIKALSAWTIGFINESHDVIVVTEFRDGSKWNIAMPPEDAITLGRALALQGEKSKLAK